jgi:hypothetical protein
VGSDRVETPPSGEPSEIAADSTTYLGWLVTVGIRFEVGKARSRSLKNSQRNRRNCSQHGLRSPLEQPEASVSQATISLA